MSVLKIKRDIQLLEQQLEKLEANISDPIECIEQKKQLEREIRKLERSKSQIEQLEQEQQELESLKSEFSPNNNQLIDHREIEQEKQVQHTASIIDTSITAGSSIDLGKQIESNRNSQVSNLNHKQENSDTIIPVISPSNNSKESGKAWIIGGTIGFFIFLGLVINGYLANQTASNIEQQTSEPVELEQSSPSLPSTETNQQSDFAQVETENTSQSIPSFTQEEAVSLIKEWQKAKSRIFAPPFDRQLGDLLLTGKSNVCQLP